MTRTPPISLALVGLAFTMACSEIPTDTQQSGAQVTPLSKKGGNANPNLRLPSYSADLTVHFPPGPGQWAFTHDVVGPEYISGVDHFSAGTENDGSYLLVNYSKGQKRKGDIRRAWINSQCRHVSDDPHIDDCSSRELHVEVTDMRAWFGLDQVDVVFHVVDNCAPWNELRFFENTPNNMPDFNGTWMANALSVYTLAEPLGTVRRRKLSTANGNNIAWCRNPLTGAEEYWHVDVDFDVTEY